MSLRLALLARAMPAGTRLKMLDELAAMTAESFGTSMPVWEDQSFESRLTCYARLTADQAQALLDAHDEAAVEAATESLRRGAEKLGARARRQLGLKTTDDAVQALIVIYKQIGIEASRIGPRELAVTRCLFADYFSEPVCRVVGALDEGIACGLSGGAQLRFVERLTAGAAGCRARLDVGEPAP